MFVVCIYVGERTPRPRRATLSMWCVGTRKIELETWKSQFATSNFPTTILSFVVVPSVGTYWLLCLVGIEPLNNFCSNNSSTFCLESKIAIM